MENVYLCDEAINILKDFDKYQTIAVEEMEKYPEEYINQLYEYKFINYHLEFGRSAFSDHITDYYITSLGSGYLDFYLRQENRYKHLQEIAESAKKQAASAESSAESARAQAAIAKENANSAKKDAAFSKVVSIIAIFISIAAIVIPLIF